MRVLHAADIRHIPLIARHGLFAGARRAACVPDTPAGHAYVERMVAEQGRRGWPMAALAFEVDEDEVTPADDPYGIGLALARPAAGLPPRLLDRVQAVEPQGRRIAGECAMSRMPVTFQERVPMPFEPSARPGGAPPKRWSSRRCHFRSKPASEWPLWKRRASAGRPCSARWLGWNGLKPATCISKARTLPA